MGLISLAGIGGIVIIITLGLRDHYEGVDLFAAIGMSIGTIMFLIFLPLYVEYNNEISYERTEGNIIITSSVGPVKFDKPKKFQVILYEAISKNKLCIFNDAGHIRKEYIYLGDYE